MNPPTTVSDLLREARTLGLARLDAELLVAHALGRSRAWLRGWPEHAPTPAQAQACRALVARRRGGEPVAYLTGEREFWSLPLGVDRHTLIPRPDTETLVERALALTPTLTALAGAGGVVRAADLGTGSGAVALALASERHGWHITATDIAPATLAVARANATRLGCDRLRLLCGDWWQPLAGERFHLVVSNPPYIAAGDPHLTQGDLRHEPVAALVAGADGLEALRAIATGAGAHLYPGGWLLLEHGLAQGEAVRALLGAAGLTDATTWRDLAGRDRVSGARAAAAGTAA